MRITQSMLSNNFLRNINQSMSSLEKIQRQLSGKKISKPSEDPVVAVRSLRYGSQITEYVQYKRNADTAIEWMDTTDDALQEAAKVIETIREKLVQGSNNGVLDEDSRIALALEIKELREQLGSLANTNISGRFIFAGTDVLTAPYQNGQFVNNNNAKITVQLGTDTFMDINTNGTEIFLFENSQGDNVFALMDKIVNALNTPDEYTGPFIDQLQEHENHFLRSLAALGSRENRLDMIYNRLEDQVVTTTAHLSKEEDADIAWVITQLSQQENVHRLALGAGARIMQPSLMDFLR